MHSESQNTKNLVGGCQFLLRILAGCQFSEFLHFLWNRFSWLSLGQVINSHDPPAYHKLFNFHSKSQTIRGEDNTDCLNYFWNQEWEYILISQVRKEQCHFIKALQFSGHFQDTVQNFFQTLKGIFQNFHDISQFSMTTRNLVLNSLSSVSLSHDCIFPLKKKRIFPIAEKSSMRGKMDNRHLKVICQTVFLHEGSRASQLISMVYFHQITNAVLHHNQPLFANLTY